MYIKMATAKRFCLYVDGNKTEGILEGKQLCLIADGTQETLDLEDIIGFEEDTTASSDYLCTFYIHVMQKLENLKLQDRIIKAESTRSDFRTLTETVKEKILSVSNRPKSLLVLINAVGGSKTGEKQYRELVAPLFELSDIKTDVIVSQRPKHFVDVMSTYDIGQIDGIVLCGGDGTVNECLRCIFKRTQEESGLDINLTDNHKKCKPLPVVIAQIPTGTGNGLAKMSTGVSDVVTSALHIIKGNTKRFNIFGVYSGNKWISCYAVLFMFGIWADMLNFMDGHRWLRTARYLFLPMYHLFMREHPVYQTKITLSKKQRKEENNQETEDMEKTEIIHEDIVNLLMFSADHVTQDFYPARGLPGRYDRTFLNLCRPCGRLQIVKQFFEIIFQIGNNMYVKDFTRNEKVTGIKVEIQNEQMGEDSNIVVNVDGEIVKLIKPEFEIRLLGRLIPVYSSKADL